MKTFAEICIEVAKSYGRYNYRRDFEYGVGVAKFTSEENFYTIAAERYANYKAKIAHDELKAEIIGLLPFHGGDVLPNIINNITNPYKQ